MKSIDPDTLLREILTRALPFIDSEHIIEDVACLLTTGEWVDSWGRDNVRYYYTELDMHVRTAMMYRSRWLKKESAPNARYAVRALRNTCRIIEEILASAKSCKTLYIARTH